MQSRRIFSAMAGAALLVSGLATLTVPSRASAQQAGASADERHACQIAGDLITAWIPAGGAREAKVTSFMTPEFKARRQQEFAARRQQGARNGNDIRITGAVVLSCTAHATGGDIVVRQERRDQITHTSSGEVSYVMYGANFRVSPKSWLVEDWQEIAE